VPHAVYYLSRALSKLGVEVCIVTESDCAPIDGIKIITARSHFQLYSLFKTFRKGFTIYHSHYSRCLPHSAYTSLPVNRARTVIEVHHFPLRRTKSYSRSGIAYRLSDSILTVSQWNADKIVSNYGLPRNKVKIIPNGVDTEVFTYLPNEASRLKKTLGLDGRKVILFVGHYASPYKGVKYLVKAAPKIVARIPNASFVLVGIPAEEEPEQKNVEEMKAEIKNHGLEANFHFLDFVGDSLLPAMYSMADVFVHPSVYESFGLPPLEAMACRRPVVVSDAGVFPELVRSGSNGILVRSQDEQALGDGILDVLSDSEFANRLGGEARKTAVEEYDWISVASRTIQHYSSLLS